MKVEEGSNDRMKNKTKVETREKGKVEREQGRTDGKNERIKREGESNETMKDETKKEEDV